jgi:hypothetical protein
LSGLSWTQATRRLVGLVAALGILVWLAIVPIVVLIGFGFGGGDAFQRLVLVACVAFIALVAMAVIGFGNASARSIARSPLSWLVLAVLTAGILWAILGIDSVRPIRSLPEADLTYPGATELGRASVPATGGFDGGTGARFTRRYATTDSIDQVEGYFGRELAQRGWTGPSGSSTSIGDRLVEWRHEGFTFQLQVPAPPTTGAFIVTIWGPSD